MVEHFTPEQIKQISLAANLYGKAQDLGRVLSISLERSDCSKLREDSPNINDIGYLKDLATELRKTTEHYNENVSPQLRQAFTWGKTIGQLESLATDVLLRSSSE